MPLEIRELNIQVNVGSQQGGQGEAAQPAQQNSGSNKDADTVKQCVEEVMDLINKQKER